MRGPVVLVLYGVLALLLVLGGGTRRALADAPCPVPTVYTVQPGDALSLIAERFGTDVATLMRLNGLDNPDHIEIGQTLRVPCLLAWTTRVQAHAAGGILLGLGIPHTSGPSPWDLWHARAREYAAAQSLGVAVSLLPPHVQPGDTAVVSLRPTTHQPLTATVRIFDTDVPLVPIDGELRGFVPLHGFVEPGVLTVTLHIGVGDLPTRTLLFPVQVISRTFDVQYVVLPQAKGALLAPDIVRAEAERLARVWAESHGGPLWQAPFAWPLDPTQYPTSAPYGGRRSYNGGPIRSYHTGQDMVAGVGTPVHAPATGVVVLAEPLKVRGNAVIIDHGAGVMSNYWHLSEIDVQPGQVVHRGDVIGKVGNTGLSTGAHLHWEMRVYGVPVDPVPWTRVPGPATWWRWYSQR